MDLQNVGSILFAAHRSFWQFLRAWPEIQIELKQIVKFKQLRERRQEGKVTIANPDRLPNRRGSKFAIKSGCNKRSRMTILATALTATAATVAASGLALSKGGTAKPPVVGAVPQLNVVPPAPPQLIPTPASTAIGFSISGMIQNASVTGGCGGGTPSDGGTVTINGVVINIPAETIVQYPANTLTWRDAICAGGVVTPVNVPPIGLDGSGGSGGPAAYPITEMRVDGNIVGADANGIGGSHIGGLAYVSQNFANGGSGFISFIDYNDGSIYVRVGGGEVRLVINDPAGRFGRAQTLDSRFSVDDANPTIKSTTGFPMCVPRSAPNAPVGFNPPAVETDPLCPQLNRPRVGSTFGCRNFAGAGITLPIAGDLAAPLAGQTFCSSFVMKAVAGMPGVVVGTPLRGNIDPDPRQQVPFEVGDFISWSATLYRGVTGARLTTTPDTFLAHTIETNLGVYTQPRTMPAYVAIGEFGLGVDPFPKATAPAVAGAESTNRIFLEAGVTDIASIVDIYLIDKHPVTGAETHRWVTMEGMTGTLAFQASARGPIATSVQPFGGGITTQYDGPQPGRARIRANKVPAIVAGAVCQPSDPNPANRMGCAVTSPATRYVRAVIRGLCAPATSNVGGTWLNINGQVPDGAVFGAAQGLPPNTTPCLQRGQFANGLYSGQYFAPVGEYIFPENTFSGTRYFANTLWQLDFIARGEGGASGSSSGPLAPTPW